MESRVLRLSCQKCHRVQTSSRQSDTPKTPFVLTMLCPNMARSPLWPADQMRFCRCFSPFTVMQEHIAVIYQQILNPIQYCIKSGAFENLRGLESISSAVEGSFHTRRPRRSGLGHRCLRDSRNSQGSVVGASRSRNLDFLQTIHVEGSWLKTITE